MDEAEFNKICNEYFSYVFNVCRKYISNKDDINDLRQDIFLKIARANGTFNPERSKIKTWIHTITENTCIDFLRKKKASPKLEEISAQTPIYSEYNPEQELLDKESWRTIDTTINHLKKKYRDVILLRYFKELSIEEIANLENSNPNTIKSRIYYVHAVLRKKLRGYLPDRKHLKGTIMFSRYE